MRILFCWLSLFALLVFPTTIRAAVTADNLLLIVNKNVPEGQKLAEYYAQQRHVPAGRIVVLDLPVGPDIAAETFDQQMVAPIRSFIAANKLETKVACLVTFYGVPLKIPNRVMSAELRTEIASLRVQLKAAIAQSQTIAESLETLATQTDATFKPAPIAGVEASETIPRRAERAASFIVAKLQQMPAGAERDELQKKLVKISDSVKLVTIPESTPTMTMTPAISPPGVVIAKPDVEMTPQEVNAKMSEMAQKRWDPADRRALRDMVRTHGGLLAFMQIVAAQEQFLTPDDSESAVDNELAAMYWGLYSRVRWQANPLCYKNPQLRGKPIVMVTRLDGGTPEQVKAIIDTSIKVESEGLKGRVVLDSRGIPAKTLTGKTDTYGIYDQMLRDLASLLQSKTKLDLLTDDKSGLIAPGTVKDCAIYCGWYSPGKYVASVSCAPGAVAYHIASFEMTALHGNTEGWCRGLLDNGAAVTLGPVAEPYLHSFPQPDDFFPLLMTGQLSLAEVYWYTNPLVSWRIAIVGDPLYKPFKVNPPLKVEDLPPRMKIIFTAPAPVPKAQ